VRIQSVRAFNDTPTVNMGTLHKRRTPLPSFVPRRTSPPTGRMPPINPPGISDASLFSESMFFPCASAPRRSIFIHLQRIPNPPRPEHLTLTWCASLPRALFIINHCFKNLHGLVIRSRPGPRGSPFVWRGSFSLQRRVPLKMFEVLAVRRSTVTSSYLGDHIFLRR